ncbi:hypothetical protein Metev_2279 (plasmid) [Methanohalobium evestigatum Z-7303]|uniref:Uncharacterized protein n=1 Tax=Methanohalobium evestigatum (strain ATCC BAA-1072 / DSM 3721 / NBRC 107634 / OCM 161 / Z-7303) TaxID=644295 RepID=D7EBX5_METEZ|nr:hypothetical protein Metev_2279 [Methanohalobium evestigatum Z-7303]
MDKIVSIDWSMQRNGAYLVLGILFVLVGGVFYQLYRMDAYSDPIFSIPMFVLGGILIVYYFFSGAFVVNLSAGNKDYRYKIDGSHAKGEIADFFRTVRDAEEYYKNEK